MGVWGLLTYVNNHAEWLKPLQLRDSLLIIDGPCFLGRVCKDIHKDTFPFGGEYYELYDHLMLFFQRLKDCNVTPIVVLDGISETNKSSTIKKRNDEKIKRMKTLNTALERGWGPQPCNADMFMFPPLKSDVFIDAMRHSNVMFARSIFEGDEEVAELARALNCPVLSSDSDFCIFDVQFISYAHMNVDTVGTKGYIDCKVFNRYAFCRDLGLQSGILPLFAVLRGNDYVLREDLAPFHKKLRGSSLGIVLNFLKGQTFHEALRYALGCFTDPNEIRARFAQIIDLYTKPSTSLVPTLMKYDVFKRLRGNVCFNERLLNLRDKFMITSTFLELYRECSLGCFVVGMFICKPYHLSPYLENIKSTAAQMTCLPIIRAIYTILLRHWAAKPPLQLLFRDKEEMVVEEFPALVIAVGSARLNGPQRRAIFYSVVEVSEERQKLMAVFPKPWMLFLISVTFWQARCRHAARDTLLESVLVHFLFIQVVQRNIGYFKSADEFATIFSTLKIKSEPEETCDLNEERSLQDLLDSVTTAESKLVAQQILPLKVDMTKDIDSAVDITAIHEFTALQNCFYYVTQLGTLLGCPFPAVHIHEMYWGTLLYGIYSKLRLEKNRDDFIRKRLSVSPNMYMIYLKTVKTLRVYLDRR